MSNLSRIAGLLQVMEREAALFCGQVQQNNLGGKAPYQLIAACLEQLPQSKRTVNDVIRLIHTKSRVDIYKQSLRYQDYGGIGYKPKKKKAKPPRQVTSDPRDHHLDSEKCPHGVPKFYDCALCDPEGFRRNTGID